MTEKIMTYNNGWDDWLCICGNNSHSEGFYPCDPGGELVEPTPEKWKDPLYRCDRCGRVIHQETHEVMKNGNT